MKENKENIQILNLILKENLIIFKQIIKLNFNLKKIIKFFKFFN